MQESCLSSLNQAGDLDQLNGNRRNANELQQLLMLIEELRKGCEADSGGSFTEQGATIY
jgi:hypothetical protein